MSNPNVCRCGKPKEKHRPLCDDCYRKEKQAAPPNRREPPRASSGVKTVFDTFYTETGYLRREIFIEAAEQMARRFEEDRMTQTQIRAAFSKLNAVDQRARREGESMHVDEVRQTYYEFVAHCEYQLKRRVLEPPFVEFVKNHLNTATKSKEEFHGFVKYLTAIMARLKTK